LHAWGGDEGAEVVEGSLDIRVEAGECLDLCGPTEKTGQHSCDGGVTSQKKVLFITTAVRTSDPTYLFLIYIYHQEMTGICDCI
jgi:hypothetical protein